mmetsp:Transcript_27461/g.68935  ORF Transcript_27461/g.68935 Transcript_27461/m.68935 type:complete len:236 (+) Transcript_27461:879-1586(+)
MGIPEDVDGLLQAIFGDEAFLGEEAAQPRHVAEGLPRVRSITLLDFVAGDGAHPREGLGVLHLLLRADLVGGPHCMLQCRQMDFLGHQEESVRILLLWALRVEHVILEGSAREHVAAAIALSHVALGRLLCLREDSPHREVIIVADDVVEERVRFTTDVCELDGVPPTRCAALAIHCAHMLVLVAPRQILLVLGQHNLQLILPNVPALDALKLLKPPILRLCRAVASTNSAGANQ